MKNPHILQYYPEELIDFFTNKLNLPAYRARQVLEQIYRQKKLDPVKMTVLPKPLRASLKEKIDFNLSSIDRCLVAKDKTKKYVFRLLDGFLIESVLIPEGSRLTLCFSTQVGCPVGCSFCATGQGGFKRSLATEEILSQILLIESLNQIHISNCVAMGQGEPLLNKEAVFKAFRILNHPQAFNLSKRHLTLSTVGIPCGIKELAEQKLPVRLAVSLHSAIQEVRDSLIPLSKTYTLKNLAESLHYYCAKTKNRITFEYLLLRKINDSLKDAKALIRFACGLPVFINLIPYNPISNLKFAEPEPENIKRFAQFLEEKGFAVAIRKEKGREIKAACGQLTQLGLAV